MPLPTPVLHLYMSASFSLQAALTLASAASESSKQQTSEKSQQIIDLQRRVNELETQVKYKTEELVDTNKQLNELKVALVTEVCIFQ